ncbi:WXG100 family type VII secretion target [Streptomyces caatingaensis]|uniref:WXG100 family type VII secretion target n=1 Tax=Streptomyces caatingaensis TaxID=1678637 RepID=A0A0K9XB73_9ACTN|nr:WXG100 family type VII secretion target [Streptomyces caatingaensis]KNB50351.1 hypothetical protein AC230_26015 [Streptomyces caatingaensis]
MSGDKLRVSDKELSDLASDLGAMGRYLKERLARLNDLVDSVDAGWRSGAAGAYKRLQTGVNEDIDRIREMLYLIEQAVRMSRDGFSAEELAALREFRRLHRTAAGERELLARADAAAEGEPSPSRSGAGILDRFS